MSRNSRIALSESIIERELRRIALIESIPDEPTTDDPEGALVIWFKRQFRPGGEEYTYAAVKAGDGLWYTTGPQAPKGYPWDQLMDWLYRNDKDGLTTQIWIATEYTLIEAYDS